MSVDSQLAPNVAAELVEKTARRAARLEALRDYITVGVNTGAGLIATFAGAADLINPNLIPAMHHPEIALGSGLAVLGGKQILKIVATISGAFK